MFRPVLPMKSNGFPQVTDEHLERLGSAMIEAFDADAACYPEEINVDLFACKYLGMKQDFQYLTNLGKPLGMTVFEDGNIPVYDKGENRMKYIYVAAWTMIIDNSILDENQPHRYRCRFTVGHEASHFILHSKYFRFQAGEDKRIAFSQLEPDLLDESVLSFIERQEKRLIERQASRLSAILLMPRKAVDALVSIMN
ncbi:MAG: ImmA/IrrE family metallo-endopeptidase [Phascolarctobacterium sp.]|nr:ImmA/IrrE family metallo-endopeptidase [Phascolarctobacterium sp.]